MCGYLSVKRSDVSLLTCCALTSREHVHLQAPYRFVDLPRLMLITGSGKFPSVRGAVPSYVQRSQRAQHEFHSTHEKDTVFQPPPFGQQGDGGQGDEISAWWWLAPSGGAGAFGRRSCRPTTGLFSVFGRYLDLGLFRFVAFW